MTEKSVRDYALLYNNVGFRVGHCLIVNLAEGATELNNDNEPVSDTNRKSHFEDSAPDLPLLSSYGFRVAVQVCVCRH